MLLLLINRLKRYFLFQHLTMAKIFLKDRVQCFSMQVVINKCFLLNLEKILTQTRLVVIEKNAHFNFEK